MTKDSFYNQVSALQRRLTKCARKKKSDDIRLSPEEGAGDGDAVGLYFERMVDNVLSDLEIVQQALNDSLEFAADDPESYPILLPQLEFLVVGLDRLRDDFNDTVGDDVFDQPEVSEAGKTARKFHRRIHALRKRLAADPLDAIYVPKKFDGNSGDAVKLENENAPEAIDIDESPFHRPKLGGKSCVSKRHAA